MFFFFSLLECLQNVSGTAINVVFLNRESGVKLRDYLGLARMKRNVQHTLAFVYVWMLRRISVSKEEMIPKYSGLLRTAACPYTIPYIYMINVIQFERSSETCYLKLDHGYHAQLASI